MEIVECRTRLNYLSDLKAVMKIVFEIAKL